MREVRMEISSDAANVVVARMAVTAFVAPLDPSIGDVTEIKTAVSEAVTNAIIHGYEEGKGVVFLHMKLVDDFLEICVSDDGVGIADVGRAREPLYTSKPDLERSGLGFTMIENFMDCLEVDSTLGQGTKVVMTKRLNQAQAGKVVSA